MRNILSDVNILISALDSQIHTEVTQKEIETFSELIKNPDISLVITPLIRYEVLRGIEKNEVQRHESIENILDGFTEISIDRKISDLSTKLYVYHKFEVENNGGTMNENKRNFDYFHFATAKIYDLELMSNDGGFPTIEKIYKGL